MASPNDQTALTNVIGFGTSTGWNAVTALRGTTYAARMRGLSLEMVTTDSPMLAVSQRTGTDPYWRL